MKVGLLGVAVLAVIALVLGGSLIGSRNQLVTERESINGNGKGLMGDFLSTLMLTLTNPMTFVAFAAVFTTMGIGVVRHQPILTAELVGGVFLGSALWWIILCGGAHLLRRHFDFRKLVTINRATGVFVIAVGVVYVVLQGTTEHAPSMIPVPKKLRAATPTVTPI